MEEPPMSKFSLNSLANALAEKSSLSQMEAELFIRKMFEVANGGLQEDKLVKIKWLGTFKVTAIKDRESINVNTGERIVLEGRDKITFTPDNILKEIVNKPFAQFETIVVNDGVDFDSIDRKFEISTSSETTDMVAEAEVNSVPEAVSETTSEVKPEETKLETKVETQPEEISETTVETQPEAISETTSEVKPEETNGVVDFLDTPAPEESLSQYDTSAEVIALPMQESQEQNDAAVEKESITESGNEKIEEEEKSVNKAEEAELQDEPTSSSHHLVIPRYFAIIACLVIVALIGGMGWFAFNYGKMQAQRDHLEAQLSYMQNAKTAAQPVAKPAKPAAIPTEDSIRQRAKVDSAKMAQASEAIKNKEQVEKAKASEKVGKEEKPTDKSKVEKTIATDKYNEDARVRTGAYRIVGVAEVVTVGDGQSLTSISNRYLGSGMECYVEALNGIKEVKRGQKVKIPKLELKKRKKATTDQ